MKRYYQEQKYEKVYPILDRFQRQFSNILMPLLSHACDMVMLEIIPSQYPTFVHMLKGMKQRFELINKHDDWETFFFYFKRKHLGKKKLIRMIDLIGDSVWSVETLPPPPKRSKKEKPPSDPSDPQSSSKKRSKSNSSKNSSKTPRRKGGRTSDTIDLPQMTTGNMMFPQIIPSSINSPTFNLSGINPLSLPSLGGNIPPNLLSSLSNVLGLTPDAANTGFMMNNNFNNSPDAEMEENEENDEVNDEIDDNEDSPLPKPKKSPKVVKKAPKKPKVPRRRRF